MPFEQVARDGADPIDFLLPQRLPSPIAPVLAEVFPEKLRDLDRKRLLATTWGQSPYFVRSSLGYSLLGLMAVFVLVRTQKRKWRWLIFGCGALVLGLGPHLMLNGTVYSDVYLPYMLLRRLPGFSMSKAAFRFVMPALLCFAVTASLAVRAITGPGQLPRRRPAALRPWIGAALLLLPAVEYCGAAPAVQPVSVSSFARAAAKDTGDYTVAYYPPPRHIMEVELRMWDQVVHNKRLLEGWVARHPREMSQPDPIHLAAMSPWAARDTPSRQAARLRALFAEPQYRIKYLIVLGNSPALERSQRHRLLAELELRYPIVVQRSEPFGKALKGLKHQTVFYVGGDAFERSRTILSELAAEVRSAVESGRPAAEVAAAKGALRQAWQDFRRSACTSERDTPAFAASARTVRAALRLRPRGAAGVRRTLGRHRRRLSPRWSQASRLDKDASLLQ